MAKDEEARDFGHNQNPNYASSHAPSHASNHAPQSKLLQHNGHFNQHDDRKWTSSSEDLQSVRPGDDKSDQCSVQTGADQRSFWRMFLDNWLYVITYCLAFGSFGVCVGFLGPTVFDLGCQTKSDQEQMSVTFTVQLILTLIGSICSGFLADK